MCDKKMNKDINKNLFELIDIDLLQVLQIGYSSMLGFPLNILSFIPETKEIEILEPNKYENKIHFNQLCHFLRSPKVDTNCRITTKNISKLVLNMPNPKAGWIYCWAGLANFYAPIRYYNRIVGLVLGGNVFIEGQNKPSPEHFKLMIEDDSIVGRIKQLSTKIKTITHADSSLILERVIAITAQLSDLIMKLDNISSITDYLLKFKLSTVLILGKDTGKESKRLEDIANIVKKMGYHPLMVKEHPDIPEFSNEDKVRSFADASRFVILENSYAAGQIAECKILATNRIVSIFLRKEGMGSSFMVTDYHKDFNFINEFTYDGKDIKTLESAIRAGVKWAEEEINNRRRFLDQQYKWRQKHITKFST